MLYDKSVAIVELLPTAATYGEAFEWAERMSIVDGDVFDFVLPTRPKETLMRYGLKTLNTLKVTPS